MCGFFLLTPPSKSPTPAECPAVQLSTDIGDRIRSQRIRAQFYNTITPAHPTPPQIHTPPARPGCHLCLWPTSCRSEVLTVTEPNLGPLTCLLCSKVTVLTLGCGEGKYSIYCRAKPANGQLMLQRPELPHGFQGKAFKRTMWSEGCRVDNFPLIGGRVR